MLFSLGAGAIHFAVTAEHLEESAMFGVFFLLLGAFQVMWALIMLRPNRPVLALGAIVNLAVIGIWVLSRTAGLPVGPEAGEPEEAGVLDGMATALEALIVLGSAWLLARHAQRHPSRVARESAPG
jgi:hypothetical protein